MEPLNSDHSKGKIGFIYPAIRNANRYAAPMMNIFSPEKKMSMVICSAFLELDPESSYVVSMKLFDPSGNEVVTSYGLDGIPRDQIHPDLRTTFLSADMHFSFQEYGCYTFKCELLEMLSYVVDTKEISFNITDVKV
jgi:hypothetical protein